MAKLITRYTELIRTALLSATFVSSFLVYFSADASPLLLAAPLLFAGFLAYLDLLRETIYNQQSILRVFARLFPPQSIPVVFVLPLFAGLPSWLTLEDTYSANYAVLMFTTLIAARIIVALGSVSSLLTSYYTASLVCIAVLVSFGLDELLASLTEANRFTTSGFHPNTLGFIFGGYFCIQLWMTGNLKGSSRYLAILSAVISIGIVLLASSRGSLVGAIAAGTVYYLALRFGFKKRHPQNSNAIRPLLIAAAATIIGGGVIVLKLSLAPSDMLNTLMTFLSLNDEYRGLDSGLSGRVDSWQSLVELMWGKAIWITGMGYRSGSLDVLGYAIDNGYLQELYEIGVVSTGIIVFKLVSLACSSARTIVSRKTSQYAPWALAIFPFLAFFLLNNLVARYLFGLGNPTSLFALFLLVSVPENLNRKLRNDSTPMLH